MAKRTQPQTSGHYILTRPKVQLQLRTDIMPHINGEVGVDYYKKVLFYAVKEAKSFFLEGFYLGIHPHLLIQGKL